MPLCLSEEQFSAFYALTARPLKSYLLRLVRNEAIADELLQESYYKLLRAPVGELAERECKNYLFRIATNLVNDRYRQKGEPELPILEEVAGAAAAHGVELETRADVERALDGLKPRERQMIWLAYVEGSSHREIAEILDLREVSVRPMLFKVKQKLADLLRGIGYGEQAGSRAGS